MMQWLYGIGELDSMNKTKERILKEITYHCKCCPCRERCPEHECVLYRIECIVVSAYWSDEE